MAQEELESKRQRLQAIRQSTSRMIAELELPKYDGSRQKLAAMVRDLELGKVSDKVVDVAEVVEKILQNEEATRTPHEDMKWDEMFKNTIFMDDVNHGNKLNKEKVIEARKLEMEFFSKMGIQRGLKS